MTSTGMISCVLFDLQAESTTEVATAAPPIFLIKSLLFISFFLLTSYFTELPFVYFPTATISVYEDTSVLCIPVCAIAETDFAVTFETVDGEKKDLTTGQMVPNGKSGEDYDVIENDARILRFKAGQKSDTIKVNITDRPGLLTGNKEFSIKLLSASGGEVSLGGFSSCKVTIIDNDHPLKSVLGAYTAKGYDYFDDKEVE